MEIKTFNTILTEICDDFDILISPKSITRSNNNIIYLMFKAIAKGYEVIHNLVVNLSYKFDPANCSDEDLESTAMLVGTDKIQGSFSGLSIVATNNNDVSTTMPTGSYYYDLDADTRFTFDLESDVVIEAESVYSFIALTTKIGVYPVTAQSSIIVSSDDITIPEGITFSCTDNTSLLGAETETTLAFRKRILSDTNRQNIFSELEMKIRNLPYVFDCMVKFNPTNSNITIGNITVPPYYMLIVISGVVKPEIAEIVASFGIYPTVMVDADKYLEYSNDVFASGKYKVYYGTFGYYDYSTTIVYRADDTFISSSVVEEKIRNYLLTTMVSNVRRTLLTENDIYNVLENLNIEGVTILSVELYVNSNRVQYINVPEDKLLRLTSVNLSEEV